MGKEDIPDRCTCDFRGTNAFLGCRCGYVEREKARAAIEALDALAEDPPDGIPLHRDIRLAAQRAQEAIVNYQALAAFLAWRPTRKV